MASLEERVRAAHQAYADCDPDYAHETAMKIALCAADAAEPEIGAMRRWLTGEAVDAAMLPEPLAKLIASRESLAGALECAARLTDERDALRELLAVMNGDGGQHAVKVGTKKAVRDAMDRHYAELAEIERLTQERDALAATVREQAVELRSVKNTAVKLAQNIQPGSNGAGEHDWACRACRPDSDILHDGFACVRHTVLAWSRETDAAESARALADAATKGETVDEATLPERLRAVLSERDSMRIGCEIAYRREPTQAEGDAHENPITGDGECFVAMGGWTGRRCRLCNRWTWGGPTACVECVPCSNARDAAESAPALADAAAKGEAVDEATLPERLRAVLSERDEEALRAAELCRKHVNERPPCSGDEDGCWMCSYEGAVASMDGYIDSTVRAEQERDALAAKVREQAELLREGSDLMGWDDECDPTVAQPSCPGCRWRARVGADIAGSANAAAEDAREAGDAADAAEALADAAAKGETPVPWEDVKKRLGINARCTWPGEDHARGCAICDPCGNHEGHVSPACRAAEDLIGWKARALAAEAEVTRLRAALERATREVEMGEWDDAVRRGGLPAVLADRIIAARRAEANGGSDADR